MNGFSLDMKEYRAKLLWCDSSVSGPNPFYQQNFYFELSTAVCGTRGEGWVDFTGLGYKKTIALAPGIQASRFFDEDPVNGPASGNSYPYYWIGFYEVYFGEIALEDWVGIKQLGIWAEFSSETRDPSGFIYGFEFPEGGITVPAGSMLTIDHPWKSGDPLVPCSRNNYGPYYAHPNRNTDLEGKVWGPTGYAQCAYNEDDEIDRRDWAPYSVSFCNAIGPPTHRKYKPFRERNFIRRIGTNEEYSPNLVRITLRDDTDIYTMDPDPGGQTRHLNGWTRAIWHGTGNIGQEAGDAYMHLLYSPNADRGWMIQNVGAIGFIYAATAGRYIRTIGINLLYYINPLLVEAGFACFYAYGSGSFPIGIWVTYGDIPVILSGELRMSLDEDIATVGYVEEKQPY